MWFIFYLQQRNRSVRLLIIDRILVKSIRSRFRKDRIKKLRVDFSPSQIGPCVVHWNSKLLSLSGEKMVDRPHIIISSHSTKQQLGMPELLSGIRGNRAVVVYKALENRKRTISYVFTTASNTSR